MKKLTIRFRLQTLSAFIKGERSFYPHPSYLSEKKRIFADNLNKTQWIRT
ncbi:hypothetical protein HMPREF9141_0772 [Prevotella multiformis DSM 16608]|uniref:Uncharacterized protein n=1 Tax=Prevotella multiformis DSM 16608 TaxID=888743 RepID=F0F5A6_9BACT|nr:hypothetical protein HMPREF9141_0772 [Prevotella multiformis DSM 16608]